MSLYNEIMEQPERVRALLDTQRFAVERIAEEIETGISAMYSWLPEELLIMPVGMPTTCLAQ